MSSSIGGNDDDYPDIDEQATCWSTMLMNTTRPLATGPAKLLSNVPDCASRSRLAGITSTVLVALFLLVLPAGCGPGDETIAIDNDDGRDIYMQNCVVCHGDPVTGENALPGTPVHGPEGHTWHHADKQLAGIIDGSINIPGRSMPSFGGKLTQIEIESVLAYIKAGWTPEQLNRQREISNN